MSPPTPSRCPRCFETIAADARFCNACGSAVDVDPWLGQTLDGKYRLDALLGEGGIGRVYRAKDLLRGADVAVKLLLGRWAGNVEITARLRREATALSLLNHANIVSLHDVGEVGRQPYLAMELVRGRSLFHELVIHPPPMEPSRIVRILTQVLEALEAAHDAGIVHRDLKPENVMLLNGTNDGVKLVDFSIALVGATHGLTRLTSSGELRGTPVYMSPEQFRGREHSPASDVYAVGVMLFELLAGEPPFSGATNSDLMAEHLHASIPRVHERGAERVPPHQLEELAHWALAKHPDDRPTARQLRYGLRTASLELPPPLSAAEEAARRAFREEAPTQETLEPGPVGDVWQRRKTDGE